MNSVVVEAFVSVVQRGQDHMSAAGLSKFELKLNQSIKAPGIGHGLSMRPPEWIALVAYCRDLPPGV